MFSTVRFVKAQILKCNFRLNPFLELVNDTYGHLIPTIVDDPHYLPQVLHMGLKSERSFQPDFQIFKTLNNVNLRALKSLDRDSGLDTFSFVRI